MNSKSEIELAWAAGLFDGEGTVFPTYAKHRPHYVKVTMAVVMTEREPVERFCRAVGVGKVKELNRKTVTGKSAYRWIIQGTADVRKVIDKLIPYLSGPKMAQAQLALDVRNEYEAKYKNENIRVAAQEREKRCQ